MLFRFIAIFFLLASGAAAAACRPVVISEDGFFSLDGRPRGTVFYGKNPFKWKTETFVAMIMSECEYLEQKCGYAGNVVKQCNADIKEYYNGVNGGFGLLLTDQQKMAGIIIILLAPLA